jgi:NAD(P)-dependent dehydrogenase (short-subunit alcohol dehydrogenase family)
MSNYDTPTGALVQGGCADVRMERNLVGNSPARSGRDQGLKTGRIGNPEDIARTVTFLASPQHIGRKYQVCGGHSCEINNGVRRRIGSEDLASFVA